MTSSLRGALRRPSLLAAAAAVAVVLASYGAVRPDSSADTLAALARLAAAARALPWPVVLLALAVPVLGAAHYLLATQALRAASGHRLSLADTVRAQLAAAAANRLLPNGLGATAVNLRFLTRSGQARGAAVSTLATLGLLGATADAAFTAAVSVSGSPLHLPGTASQLAALAGHGVRAGAHLPWPALLTVAVLAVGWVGLRRRRRGGAKEGGLRQVGAHVAGLARSPRRLAVLWLSSGATTAALAFAFAASVYVVTGGHPGMPLGALVVTYLVAGAIGGSMPLPAFVGTTEAALVAGLVVGGVHVTAAVVAVVAFRLVTFWAPVPAGLLAARRLRRQALL